MATAKLLLTTDIDLPSRQILEKLLYKTRDLLSKDSLKAHYAEQVSSLNMQLEMTARRVEDLAAENEELKRKCAESAVVSPRQFARPTEPSSFILRSTVRLSKQMTSRVHSQILGKNTVYEEFNNRLTSLFNVFNSLNNDEGIYSLMNTIENSFKYSMSCDRVMIIRRVADYQCECSFGGQVLIFPNLEDLLAASSLLVANTILPDDTLVSAVYSSSFYSIYNYMVVPKRSDKERLASELIVFLNKQDGKRANLSFGKLDEVFGILSGHIYSLISDYNFLLKQYDKAKVTAKVMAENISELLTYVAFIVILRTP